MDLFTWLGLRVNAKPLEIGARAPDPVLFDVHGSEVRLARHYWDGFTLVYFYPKASTPGCTKQACALREKFEELKARNIDVIGISADPPGAVQRFQETHKLPFMVLADPEYHAAEAFGIPLLFGMPRRQSYLIRAGKIVWRDLNARTGGHAADVLAAVEKLPPIKVD